MQCLFSIPKNLTQIKHVSRILRFIADYIPDKSPFFIKSKDIPKEIHVKTDNLRYDKMMSVVLDVSRNRIDIQTSQNRVYVNGIELKKKGKKIKKGDIIEVDFESSERKYLFERGRVEVLQLNKDNDYYNVVFRRFKLYGFVLRDENVNTDSKLDSS